MSLLALVLIFTAGYEAIYGRWWTSCRRSRTGKASGSPTVSCPSRIFVGLAAALLWSAGCWSGPTCCPISSPRVTASRWPPGTLRALDPRLRRMRPLGIATHKARIHRLAPLYVVLYALVVTLVAFDGIMALQPHWFSNLLGGFYFMGSFLGRPHAARAADDLRRESSSASTDLVTPKQRHDLGKLCFGFTVFWAYLMWAQFLVIWYGNMPEETGFVFARLWGPWLPVGPRSSSGCS